MAAEVVNVAVVGGGIGGMALANALLAQGAEVRVFEQSPTIGEVGAGVMMTPNSRRPLEKLGLGPALARVGGRVGEGSEYYRNDGTTVAPVLTHDSHGNGLYGMHRADLLGVLHRALPEGVVKVNHRCVGFEQDDDRARIKFADGTSYEADVVVAADGIQSALRNYVTEPSTPVHSGSVAYRGLIPVEKMPFWRKEATQLWMGDGKHFLVYPVRSGELIAYIGFVPTDEQTAESWSAPGDRDALAAAFSDWDERVVKLLEQVETTYWWGLYDREPLERWTEGRLALLGDAAHPMLPHLGQGANQSIEDGIALAQLLAGRSPDQAPAALLDYESLRRPRTTDVQLEARRNGLRYDSAHGDLEARDAEIAGSVEFRSWLYDYDVELAVKDFVASQRSAATIEG